MAARFTLFLYANASLKQSFPGLALDVGLWPFYFLVETFLMARHALALWRGPSDTPTALDLLSHCRAFCAPASSARARGARALVSLMAALLFFTAMAGQIQRLSSAPQPFALTHFGLVEKAMSRRP